MNDPRFTFQQSVLFIDDQTKFENLIRGGLLTFPGQVEFCPSRVKTALDRLQRDPPDLIISTLEYREGNVLDLIRKAGSYFEHVPSLYLSEPHLADIEAEMALLGRFQVLERSYDLSGLILKMNEVIAENLGKEKLPGLRLMPGKESKEEEASLRAAVQPLSWADAILKRAK